MTIFRIMARLALSLTAAAGFEAFVLSRPSLDIFVEITQRF